MMSKLNYLSIDVETGGLGLDKSLLEISLIVAEEHFEETGNRLTLRVKPDDGNYVVTAQGLSVNKINLVEHDEVAFPYKNVKPILYEFLKSHSQSGAEKLVPVGKNVYFDITHLWDKLISRGSWDLFCSYQTLEISSAWRFLESIGKVPRLPKTSLSNLCDYLGIPVVDLHSAEGDALTNLKVMKGLVKLV